MASKNVVKVLFVCLGNICRSPMAEGVFKKLTESKKTNNNYQCDSAGTSAYHIGEQPDSRMKETALKHGVSLVHAAQQVTKEDFCEFDYIVAMDRNNYDDILALGKPSEGAEVVLLRKFDPIQDSLDVPDPYYGGEEGFQKVYEIVDRSCDAFLQHLEKDMS